MFHCKKKIVQILNPEDFFAAKLTIHVKCILLCRDIFLYVSAFREYNL